MTIKFSFSVANEVIIVLTSSTVLRILSCQTLNYHMLMNPTKFIAERVYSKSIQNLALKRLDVKDLKCYF